MRYVCTGYCFGHEIQWHEEDENWHYSDTGAVCQGGTERKCPKCNLNETAEGHDPCIANLPGVKYACCGHGVESGYIMFEDGTCIRFDNAEVTRPKQP